jgi:hypothetical protein
MDMDRYIEFDVAEVLEYDYTYQYISNEQKNSTVNNLFAIKVKSCSRLFNSEELLAKPSSMYAKRIPLVGEFVLIYKTFNQESTATRRREQWYYISTVGLHGGINENRLPGIARDIVDADKVKPGYTFKSKTVSPLQPYEGDYILEGRFGNSIRFGSTVKYSKGLYTKKGIWSGDKSGDPIIVISNGRTNKTQKEFVTEQIDTDAASIYLTSTQNIPSFHTWNTIEKAGVRNSASQFNKSQLIGTADRIILKSKTDSVVLDSNKNIQLLAPQVYIGTGPYEPMVQSSKIVDVLNKIIRVINTGFTDGSTTCCPVDTSLDIVDLTELTSNHINISKWRS